MQSNSDSTDSNDSIRKGFEAIKIVSDDAQSGSEDRPTTSSEERSDWFQKQLTNFHNEIVNFYEMYGPNDKYDRITNLVFKDVKTIIMSCFPNWKIKLYGSR